MQLREWDLDDKLVGRQIWEEMRERIAGSPPISSFWVLDADGNSVLDTWDYPSTPGNYRHRD